MLDGLLSKLRRFIFTIRARLVFVLLDQRTILFDAKLSYQKLSLEVLATTPLHFDILILRLHGQGASVCDGVFQTKVTFILLVVVALFFLRLEDDVSRCLKFVFNRGTCR